MSTRALAIVLSEDIYRTVVRHGYDRIEADSFAPLVWTQMAGQTHRGWVRLPGWARDLHGITRGELSPTR